MGLNYKQVHHKIKTKGETLKSIFGETLQDYITPYVNYDIINGEKT